MPERNASHVGVISDREQPPSPRLKNLILFPPVITQNLRAQIFPGTTYLRHVADLALGLNDNPFAPAVTEKRQNGA